VTTTQNSFGLTFFFNFNLRFRRNGTHKDKISHKQKKYIYLKQIFETKIVSSVKYPKFNYNYLIIIKIGTILRRILFHFDILVQK